MKKLLALFILLCLIPTQAMAELKLGDRASVVNCQEFVSLRMQPDTSTACISKLELNTTVNVCGNADNGFVQVEANGKTGYVLGEYLELSDAYENYAGETMDLTDQQRYNINLFLSNFSEQQLPTYDEFDAFNACNVHVDEFLLDFAVQHLLFNREDKFEMGNFAMGEMRLAENGLDDVVWKYFKRRPSSTGMAPYSYSDGYYYLNLADQRIDGGFVSVNRVDALGDSRYAVRFGIYDADCGCWENDACSLTPGEAALRYDRSAEGLAVIVVNGDGTMGSLEDRSTWRLERWITNRVDA